ncbi:MAG TPA: acyl-[ACP]--phospholipid O-acyltransferase [Terriglobales bacterium]|nr:acyl-[ACP]--phospholipid O-acyltransferase [Terriglobales bacterium]
MENSRKGWKLGFWSLIATQFQGAFNDNGLKFFVIFLVLGTNPSQEQKDFWVFLIGNLFAIPFLLFSMTGGFLADRYSKRSVTIATKIFEVGAMVFALYAFSNGNVYLSFVVIFLASTQAAIFGPSKYGLLPEVLPSELLSWGNGVLELTTFVAIILGAVIGPLLAQLFRGREALVALFFGGCTLIGLVSSLGISRVLAADSNKNFRWNIFGDLRDQFRLIRPDRVLKLAIVGNTYFWFLGALLQFVIVFYGRDILRLDEAHGGYLQAALAIGIGVGSFAAGYLSGNKIEYGLIPLGAVGMTTVGFALSLHGLTFDEVIALLALLGFAGGFFVVPINALIQHRPEERHKGSVIAFANFLSFVGILLASAVYSGLTHYFRVRLGSFFIWTAVISLGAAAYVVALLPDSMLRMVLWFATHTLYRLRIKGAEYVPTRGGALLVPNHASMLDAILLLTTTDRPIRFLMYQRSYEHWLVKPFAKVLKVIPISSQQRPRELIHSLREATDALKNGELVCIFPEGQMTRIGQLLPFRRGMERIMKGVEAPIIPVHIDGVWGSIFSFSGGRYLWKFPRKIPYPVYVTYGAPLPPTATSTEARQAVQELGVESFDGRKRYMRTLHRTFLRTARRHPFRFAMADSKTRRLSYFSALAKTIFLARRLRHHWREQSMVGILLPPSIPGALLNYAAFFMGKVPVNLNYTASAETLASCARQCGLQTVMTSRLFLEKVKIQPPGEVRFLEDIAEMPRTSEKLGTFLAAILLPASLLEKFCGTGKSNVLDDTATVIFSSGSTGDPKGVVLSHYNIASNVHQLLQVFTLHASDRILGILPFFHSFGFTGTLCLPPAAGMGVVFYPSPIDARVIGALVNQHSVTMLLATPTFLNAYMRRCPPEDFGSLRIVMAGAEKLTERIAVAFEDHFGIRPLEGYGCTECSPVVAVNTYDFRAADFRQVGAKRGTIGHPLPGIAVRILHPESLEALPPGQSGLLLVRGPNVMRGYLNHAEKTAEVLVNGWYNTGDIAALDEDGFLRITDRLSRFSKIGGEMVPHIKVEETLQEIADATEQVFAVTSVPDERKGERLVVLTTIPEEKLAECLSQLAKSDLPALWKPKPDQFVRIESLPYLGTGKLDLRRLRELALELQQKEPRA